MERVILETHEQDGFTISTPNVLVRWHTLELGSIVWFAVESSEMADILRSRLIIQPLGCLVRILGSHHSKL